MKLKRYWFIIYPEDRYGQGNFGVTAYSIPEAKQLLNDEMRILNLQDRLVGLDNAEVIEDIDIRLLDKGHVTPNMGVVTFKGVWFPNLSLR